MQKLHKKQKECDSFKVAKIKQNKANVFRDETT